MSENPYELYKFKERDELTAEITKILEAFSRHEDRVKLKADLKALEKVYIPRISGMRDTATDEAIIFALQEMQPNKWTDDEL